MQRSPTLWHVYATNQIAGLFPFPLAVVLGLLAAVLTGVYSSRVLLALLCFDQVPRPVAELLSRFGFASVIAERAR